MGAVTSGSWPDRGARLHFGQAEVEDLGVSALGDEDVRGLDVAMDDAAGVRRVERVGDLDAERKDGFEFHRAAADQVLERRTVEELHDEEGAAVVLADVVNGADIGMIQSGSGFGFAAKTLEGLAILREIFGKKLQGDEAAEARVLGLVNHAHAAAAELFDDPVVRNSLIEHDPGETSLPIPVRR